CLVVSNLTHKDNIWSLSQHGPDNSSEVQPDLVFHLHLIHAGQIVFDGVFGSNDLSIRPIQFVQSGIERRCLPQPGWSRYQHDSVWSLDDALESLIIVVGKPEIPNVYLNTASVKNAHNGGLAVVGGQHADAQVVMFAP